MGISVYYDGECPFCSNYVRLLRLKASAGTVHLIDLRAEGDARERLAADGLDLDKGMVVEVGGRTYHGADAMNALSLLSSKSGTLNRAFAALFRHRHAASLLYPVLRAGRNATLFALGRRPIHEGNPGEVALFALFNRFFGLFVLLNACYFLNPGTTTERLFVTPFLLLLGGWLFLFPASRRVFVATVITQTVDTIVQAPVPSNHVILEAFLLLAFYAAAAWHLLRGNSFDEWFRSVRPVGRCLLLTMYVFGIFHKINTGFLNPDVSCAVQLWRTMPPPLVWIDTPAMHYIAIYGTFLAEGAILAMLLWQRLRHVGIIAGILFHALLALSSYALYAPFSTLATALHVLFLTPALAIRIVASRPYRRVDRLMHSGPGLAVMICIFLFVAAAGFSNEFHQATFAWLLAIAAPATLMVWQGWRRDRSTHENSFFWSRPAALNAIGALFFLNCISPYLGLKTAQSMNMFANIRVEGGVSNHLIMRSSNRPFHYLDGVVVITDAGNARGLAWYQQHQDVGLVYYAFLDVLRKSPRAIVSYRLNGRAHTHVPASLLLRRDGHVLFPTWVNKFFQFKPVKLRDPIPCD